MNESKGPKKQKGGDAAQKCAVNDTRQGDGMMKLELTAQELDVVAPKKKEGRRRVPWTGRWWRELPWLAPTAHCHVQEGTYELSSFFFSSTEEIRRHFWVN